MISDSVTCEADQFTCHNPGNNTNCIPLNWVCDGEHDCEDKSDEVSCSKISFISSTFKRFFSKTVCKRF